MHEHPYSTRRLASYPLWFICPGLFFLAAELAFAHPLSVEVQNPDGSAAAGIAVYLEALDRKLPAGSNDVAIEILQQDKGFVPYVSAVQAGSTVTFSNHDDITHHIYSVTGSQRFSFNLRAGEVTPEMVIEQSGLIAMGCNIHDWMSGYLLVVESPYYGTTDAQGRAVIEVGDAGNYRIVTWHPEVEKSVEKVALLPMTETIVIQLGQGLAIKPRQKGVDNFDFLEGY